MYTTCTKKKKIGHVCVEQLKINTWTWVEFQSSWTLITCIVKHELTFKICRLYREMFRNKISKETEEKEMSHRK